MSEREVIFHHDGSGEFSPATVVSAGAQICLVRYSRAVKQPLVSGAGCQSPSPAPPNALIPPQKRPSPSDPPPSLRRSRRSLPPRRCYRYQFPTHEPSDTGGVHRRRRLCSFNWFTISDCHLKRRSLPARRVQSTCQLASSVDSESGLTGVVSQGKKKENSRGFFTTLLFGLCD